VLSRSKAFKELNKDVHIGYIKELPQNIYITHPHVSVITMGIGIVYDKKGELQNVFSFFDLLETENGRKKFTSGAGLSKLVRNSLDNLKSLDYYEEAFKKKTSAQTLTALVERYKKLNEFWMRIRCINILETRLKGLGSRNESFLVGVELMKLLGSLNQRFSYEADTLPKIWTSVLARNYKDPSALDEEAIKECVNLVFDKFILDQFDCRRKCADLIRKWNYKKSKAVQVAVNTLEQRLAKMIADGPPLEKFRHNKDMARVKHAVRLGDAKKVIEYSKDDKLKRYIRKSHLEEAKRSR